MDPTATPRLLVLAQRTLGLTQQGMADLLETSLRTAQRWGSKESFPTDAQLHRLAREVFPKDNKLAAEIAASAGTTLVALGLVAPPRPPEPVKPLAPAPPPRPPAEELVRALLCAASEAINLMPRDVEPALLAALACGRRLGMTMEEAEQGLLVARDTRERAAAAGAVEAANVAEATKAAKPKK